MKNVYGSIYYQHIIRQKVTPNLTRLKVLYRLVYTTSIARYIPFYHECDVACVHFVNQFFYFYSKGSTYRTLEMTINRILRKKKFHLVLIEVITSNVEIHKHKFLANLVLITFSKKLRESHKSKIQKKLSNLTNNVKDKEKKLQFNK